MEGKKRASCERSVLGTGKETKKKNIDNLENEKL